MPKYAIHNASGDILRVLDVPAEAIALQLQDGEYFIEGDAETHDAIDVSTGTVIRRPAPEPPQNPPLPVEPEYAVQRKQLYPPIEVQLDLLWHAMDADEIPKAAAFYERIKVVKDTVPKDNIVDPVIVYTVDEVPE